MFQENGKAVDGVGCSAPVIRPRDEIALLREEVETTLERQKTLNHHWEDQIVEPVRNPCTSNVHAYGKQRSGALAGNR
jgi:hypothetical protein